MLQSMLLQEQREKLVLQAHLEQELHNERAKSAVLEQELAQLSAAAQEMGNNFVQYFSSAPPPADTRTSHDQQAQGPAQLQSSFGSPFVPAALQLQVIPENLQKPEEMLALAEQLKHFAAGWQHRLANGRTGNTPSAAECAAAAAAGPFADSSAAAAAGKGPSRMHSISVPSELNGSMDLPMQALAASRLALQLHQPHGAAAGDDTSCFSSSGRKSSCTVLGASVDLTSSISSFRSFHNAQQAQHAAGPGAPEAAPHSTAEGGQLSHQALAARRAADRGARARGAAAVAASCASIAGQAAASAAASAARTAAHAAAMADISLRASTESGFSALTSPGKSTIVSGGLSSTLQQRQEWQARQQQQWQHQPQALTSNPLWAPVPVEDEPGSDGGESDSDSMPGTGTPYSQTDGNTTERLPGSMWGTPLQAFTAYDGDTPSPSLPTSPLPEAPPSVAQSAQHTAGALQRLPAVPAHLTPQAQRAGEQQQEGPMQGMQRVTVQVPPHPQHLPPFRYGSDKLSMLSPLTESSYSSAPGAAPGAMQQSAQQQQQYQATYSSFASRPPMYMVDTPAKRGAKPSGVGPLHKHLSSLSTSFGSLMAAGRGSVGDCSSCRPGAAPAVAC